MIQWYRCLVYELRMSTVQRIHSTCGPKCKNMSANPLRKAASIVFQFQILWQLDAVGSVFSRAAAGSGREGGKQKTEGPDKANRGPVEQVEQRDSSSNYKKNKLYYRSKNATRGSWPYY